MAVAAIFYGDAADKHDLLEAIGRNCECAPPQLCSAHRALLDQRFLDGLLFARFLIGMLLYEEFDIT